MKITSELLRELEACGVELREFQREWPDGAEVTMENCRRAYELDLDMDWLANRALPEPLLRAYARRVRLAQDMYDQTTYDAMLEYNKAQTAANRATYNIVNVYARRDKMRRFLRKHTERYEAVAKPAREVYVTSLLTAFCELMNACDEEEVKTV